MNRATACTGPSPSTRRCTLEAPFGPCDFLRPERADVGSVDEVFHGVARGAWVAAALVLGDYDRFGTIAALVDRGTSLSASTPSYESGHQDQNSAHGVA